MLRFLVFMFVCLLICFFWVMLRFACCWFVCVVFRWFVFWVLLLGILGFEWGLSLLGYACLVLFIGFVLAFRLGYWLFVLFVLCLLLVGYLRVLLVYMVMFAFAVALACFMLLGYLVVLFGCLFGLFIYDCSIYLLFSWLFVCLV